MAIEQMEIIAYTDGQFQTRQEKIAVEATLDISVNGIPAHRSLRMPGLDTELAVGWCFCQGLIHSGQEVREIRAAEGTEIDIVTEKLAGPPAGEADPPRDPHNDLRFTPSFLFDLQGDFFTHQQIFSQTGAAHSAALYDQGGRLLAFAEDVGRHNAFDKCVGSLLLKNRLREAVFCLLSSRLSQEMANKACRAGLPVLAGVSAPTTLAVALARQQGMTLIGFLRPPRFNLYAGEWRLERA